MHIILALKVVFPLKARRQLRPWSCTGERYGIPRSKGPKQGESQGKRQGRKKSLFATLLFEQDMEAHGESPSCTCCTLHIPGPNQELFSTRQQVSSVQFQTSKEKSKVRAKGATRKCWVRKKKRAVYGRTYLGINVRVGPEDVECEESARREEKTGSLELSKKTAAEQLVQDC